MHVFCGLLRLPTTARRGKGDHRAPSAATTPRPGVKVRFLAEADPTASAQREPPSTTQARRGAADHTAPSAATAPRRGNEVRFLTGADPTTTAQREPPSETSNHRSVVGHRAGPGESNSTIFSGSAGQSTQPSIIFSSNAGPDESKSTICSRNAVHDVLTQPSSSSRTPSRPAHMNNTQYRCQQSGMPGYSQRTSVHPAQLSSFNHEGCEHQMPFQDAGTHGGYE